MAVNVPYNTDLGFVRNLICAVIIQAIEDYQSDLKTLDRNPKQCKERSVNRDITEINSFLRSGICEAVGIPQREILDNINCIIIPKMYKSSEYTEDLEV